MMKKLFNKRKLNKNNRGYSLVELIVTIAILSFVGAVVAAFVGMSMNSFRNNSAEVNVQYQAQLAANQMGNAILSATNGMSFNQNAEAGSKKLELYSVEKDNSGKDHKIVKSYSFLPPAEGVETSSIVYVEKDTSEAGTVVSPEEPFAKFITDFNVVIKDKDNVDITTTTENTEASKVEITLKYKNDNKIYEEKNLVTLRNEIALSTSEDSDANAELFFKELTTVKYTRVNNVDFTTEPGKNYLWVGKQYALAEVNGGALNSPIKEATTGSDTIIKNADFNVSNPTADTKYGFNWGYGIPGPKSTLAYTDEEKTVPNIVASGDKIMLMVGADETSPFQVVGTSIESLPDPDILAGTDEEAKTRENNKRAKSDSVIIYPKHLSNVSISSTPTGGVTDATLTLRVGVTVKYAGPDSDISGNRERIVEALTRGEAATVTTDAEGKEVYNLSDEGAIACFLTEIHDEKAADGITTVMVKGTPQLIKLQPQKRINDSGTEEYVYAKSGDSVTYYFETVAPYDVAKDTHQRYICNVVGNTLGLSVDRPASASANPIVDINKCILGFGDDVATRLCAGESITLSPQLTVRSTKEDIPLTIDGTNVKLSVSAALKGNEDIGTANISKFCTFDASTGQIKINNTLDGSYSMTIKVEYKQLQGLIRIYADAVEFDILKEDGSQFLTQKEARSQNYEFIPVGVDLSITMRVYSAGDIKKKPLDASKYVLMLATDCNSPANCTPTAGTGCTLNFYYNNERYKGTLKLELCRYNENGTTDDEKYHRLGVFQTLDVMSDNPNVGMVGFNNTGGETIFIPTEIRTDSELGWGQKTSERYSDDKRINVDFYWFYDVFGNAAGYNSVVKVDGHSPAIRVKKTDGTSYNCYYTLSTPAHWIREGH